MSSESDRYLGDAQAAEFLGLSRGYLRQLRVKGDGPRFACFGRAIRYRLSELEAWARGREVASTTERVGTPLA
jgi:predicted DNA-binding transcriptional regulator AlpA